MKNRLIILIIAFACLGFLSAMLLAADPAWWSTGSTSLIDSSASNATAYNYEPLNIGQLKNVATQAKAYLDTELSSVGGSGPTITTMVNGFSTGGGANYEPANIGQVKAVAAPFYDRLNEIAYNTTANLVQRGGWGDWPSTDHYAWNTSTSTAQNYAPANLGQLKMVFSFDLNSSTFFSLSSLSILSTNTWGIPDAWLVSNGLDPFDSSIGTEDPDGDGVDNYHEYLDGTDPLDKDNGSVTLTLFR